jgi:hypothetical protein
MSEKECPQCQTETGPDSTFCPQCGYNYSTGKHYPKKTAGWVIGCAVAAGLSLLVVPVIGLLAAIAIPSFMKSRETSQMNACINNMRQIEAAKEGWALETGKANGDPVDEDAVNHYIKGGMPWCPAGGMYYYNAIGEDATCDYPDAPHALPSMGPYPTPPASYP